MEYCCYLGIQVFRLLFARGLRIPPYLRCCAYTWPCAMRRVPGRLRTCAERRLGACLCRLGYGNLAGFPSPRSTFVADINLSIPKEREGQILVVVATPDPPCGRSGVATITRTRQSCNAPNHRAPCLVWRITASSGVDVAGQQRNLRCMMRPKTKKPGGGGRRVREKREEGFSYGVRKNLATGMNFIPLTSSI
mgnify:CR=1 FL=1